MGQVKNVVFPTDTLPVVDVDGKAHELYVKTHGAYNPGEQRRRDYNWPSTGVNPATHSFGAVDKDNYQQGVKKALQPALDQTLQQPARVSNKIYEDFKAQVGGEGSGRGGGRGWDAWECGHHPVLTCFFPLWMSLTNVKCCC